MSRKMFFYVVFFYVLFSCSPIAEANRNAKNNEQKQLFPNVKFNELIAKKQLTKGRSTIKGVLFAKNGFNLTGGRKYASEITINLFPVNEYFMDWYDLREKKEDKNTSVYMSNEAYSHRIETKTDNFGRFTFLEMKPGKYFLQAFMSTTDYFNNQVPVGTGSNGYVTTTYYENQRTKVTRNHRIEKFLQVKKEGDVLEINLRN